MVFDGDDEKIETNNSDATASLSQLSKNNRGEY